MGFLAFIYGDDYNQRLLSGELISFAKNTAEADSARIFVFTINVFALVM